MVLTKVDIDEALNVALSAQTILLKTHIDESVSAVRNEIINIIQDENKKLKEQITNLENKNNMLEDKVIALEGKFESNLQYQRNSSVIINGIPNEVPHNNLEGIVINIFNTVCFHTITNRDIIACHRLSTRNDSIVVKFVNKKDATALLQSTVSIKEFDKSQIAPNCINIFVNEHLTPLVGELAYRWRCLKRANKVYQTKVERGIVKVLTNKDGNFRWYNVNSIDDIQQFNQCIALTTEGHNQSNELSTENQS